ncbi:MAG: glutathione S-transferase family protein [Oceanicaulis sp.]|nr:glutathione S-transferase family protein [Oceanicaulis sp.]
MVRKKLFYTPNSPYARVARVAARQSGLAGHIEEVEAKTRDKTSWYFQVTPLARVPVLVDGDILLADTRDICAHFDELTGSTRWFPKETHQARYSRHIACGFLDGVAVWLREKARPDGQKSAPVMHYEEHRARTALQWLETRWNPVETMDFTALVLACAIEIAIDRGMGGDWENLAPKTMDWAARKAADPDMRATKPLPL